MDMIGGCCVCLDERGWDENPLVYCDGDGCNVAVHQACYGIVKVPIGPWFCCKCRSTERVARVKCELCPFKEGALKRTDNGGWAHVVCALYIPEVRFGNVTTMEPIKMSSVPHERFLKACYICEEAGRDSRTANGACMSCNKPGCKLNFHVTCAQAKRLLCEEAGHFGNVQYVGYCVQHWAKKFGPRHHGPENDKKHRDKKQSKHDHTPTSEPSKPKKKDKTYTASKSVERTSDKPDKSDKNNSSEPILAKAGSAEKSAAESLNLLQQMPGLLDYFPNGDESKTPLNSLIASNESTPVTNSFNMANILSNEKEKKKRNSSSVEDFIDVVDARKISDSGGRGVEKGKDVQKLDGKHKSLLSTGDRASVPGGKATSQTKKLVSSQQKGNAHPKPISSEGKKRKSLPQVDSEKKTKKKKIEEKRKAKPTLQKTKELGLPRPSKADLFENDRIPSLFPRNFGEKSPETFQDLLEFQWNHGAQFLIQKAKHYDVGSLLSCLYQLRSENDALEKRLEQLSARRDRLIAATTRLSSPLTSTPNTDRQVPLSSMLARLKSDPDDATSSHSVRPKIGGNCNDSSTNGAALSSSAALLEGRDVCCNENSENRIEDLDCKEVLSDGNSLSGTPPKESKKTKQSKRDSKVDTKERENGVLLHESLVQPPIVKPSDSHIVGGITASHVSQNPADFIHQIVRQQQHIPHTSSGQPGHPVTSNLLDFINGQANILGTLKSNDKTPRDGRNVSNKLPRE